MSEPFNSATITEETSRKKRKTRQNRIDSQKCESEANVLNPKKRMRTSRRNLQRNEFKQNEVKRNEFRQNEVNRENKENEIKDVKANKTKQDQTKQEIKQNSDSEGEQLEETSDAKLDNVWFNSKLNKVSFHYYEYSTNNPIVIGLINQFLCETQYAKNLSPALSTTFITECFKEDLNMLQLLQFLIANDSINLSSPCENAEERIAEIREDQAEMLKNIISQNHALVNHTFTYKTREVFTLVDVICSKIVINLAYLRIVLPYVTSLKGTVVCLLKYETIGESQLAALKILLQHKDVNGKMVADLTHYDSEDVNAKWALLRKSTLSSYHISCLEELIKAGLDPNELDSTTGESLLHIIVSMQNFDSSHVRCVQMILPYFTNINCAVHNPLNNIRTAGTVLHHLAFSVVHSNEAFNEFRFEAFKLLIDKGANVNFLEFNRLMTPLMILCERGTDFAIHYVEFLLQQPTINLDLVNKKGVCALQMIMFRSVYVIKLAQLLINSHMKDTAPNCIVKISMCLQCHRSIEVELLLVPYLVDLFLTEDDGEKLGKCISELSKPSLVQFYIGVHKRLQQRKFSLCEPFATIVKDYL